MKNFQIGQRWVSESEPELGLGLVVAVESKNVGVFFPASQVERLYGAQSAPLRRVRFQAGDEIRLQDGTVHTIHAVTESAGVFSYETDAGVHSETKLADTLVLTRPEERFFAGHADSLAMAKLRYDVLLNLRQQFLSPVRGFLGGRLSLIPHQFHVAREITSRPRPRVMLADEVGLGKTIEAGLIIHQLLLSGRAERVLVLVPDSLVYQWFVEMLKKFGLAFTTINHESKIEEGDDPFSAGQLFIASTRFIMSRPDLQLASLEQDWDMLVVDEAHQLRWSSEQASPEYEYVAGVSAKAEGLILLSGTPEILGLAGHFARLKLLDPERFHDYGTFVEETTGYQEISAIAKILDGAKPLSAAQGKRLSKMGLAVPTTAEERTQVLKDLLDRHGTGRVYFRNTRARMATFAESFPKRLLHPAPLKPATGKEAERKDYQSKVDWLVEHLGATAGSKTLLLCRTKDMVMMLEASLKQKSSAKAAVFHSELPLMHRDRAAAWFADPEGAQVLLSTESGAEGRNFEFAQHLILFDLPKLPDLLEQRIGRLDRIGQKNDINIHVPYFKGSVEEVLFEWYDQGFKAFTTSPRGASELYATVREELLTLLAEVEAGQWPEKGLKALVNKTKTLHAEIEERLEEGQDRLIELNSFDAASSEKFLANLRVVDSSPDLKNFLVALFETLGVDMEDLDGTSFFARPSDNMFLPYFPYLPPEGLSFTFDRSLAMRRPELAFMSWDHPLVTGILEFVASKEMGNANVSTWRGKALEPFLFEGFYVLQTVADRRLQANKWFPPTPVRVLLNAKLADMTQKLPKKELDALITNAPPEKRKQAGEIPRDMFKAVLKHGRQVVAARAKQYQEKFIAEMEQSMDAEITRLKKLREVNPTVSLSEITKLESDRAALRKAMLAAEVSLDSFRVVL